MKELIIKKGDKQITVADKEDVMDALDNKVSTSDPRLSDTRTPKSHTHNVVDLSNYMPKSSSSAGTDGYMKILNIKTNQAHLDDPITFEIYQRKKDKPIYCSVLFSGSNNTDPTISSFESWGSDNEVYIYKASTNNWQIIVKKADAYESLTVENINCNWGRWNLWATNPSNIFTHLDETITTLPSNTTSNPLIKATYNISNVLTDTDTDRSLSANQGKVLKGLIDGKASSNDPRLSDSRNPTMNHIGASSSTTKDLDNYMTAGFYYCNHDTNEAPYINNQPSTTNRRCFFLLVEAWDITHYVKQTLTYYNTGDTYIRTKKGNSAGWSTWQKLSINGHTHSYLPLSGGTLTGGVKHQITRIGTSNAQHDNLPWAGTFDINNNLMTTLKANKSLIGTTTFGGNWWNVISVRHRNGSGDGTSWGMVIKAPLTTNTDDGDAHLTWQRDLDSNVGTEKTIIDNKNMVKHEVVNNVLSRATNNQNETGYFKILTIRVKGSYTDSNIKFSVNRRHQPASNVDLYFTYEQKDTSSSSNPRYYKLDKCYYDGQSLDIRVKQTADNVSDGTFDVYIYAEAWADTTITPIITNNLRSNSTNLIITPQDSFVTSLPSGCIQGIRNGNYVAGDDIRLSNARTPTSHTHGSIANGGTLNSDITSVNKVVVTDSSSNIKTISKLPASAVTHQDISGKADKSSYVTCTVTYTDGRTDTINLVTR